jgi:hypothetical protein
LANVIRNTMLHERTHHDAHVLQGRDLFAIVAVTTRCLSHAYHGRS